MPKRFTDLTPYQFDYYQILRHEEILVTCKNGDHPAYLTERNGEKMLFCPTCAYRNQIQLENHPHIVHTFRYRFTCKNCGKYHRHDETSRSTLAKSRPCPACRQENQPFTVEKVTSQLAHPVASYLKRGIDPWAARPLYFQDSIRGEVFFAYNRRHLTYLKKYIEADLRERPIFPVAKTAAHTLPKSLKQAKNRPQLLQKIAKLERKL
ncbi:hypothetical protein [Listeria costaricensis]|uniref:hypothetical protein n=1 Tax=Listeria costaricensis TaxID=2026604 RepID=UPI000C0762EC|nr:hypothetical protein [Listeria costaricensis]